MAATLGPICIAGPSPWRNSSDPAVKTMAERIFVLGVSLTIVGALASWKRSKRITLLEATATNAQKMRDDLQNGYSELVEQHQSICQDLIRVLLSSIAARMEFGDSERISLYGHNGTEFLLVGRFSKHPEYAKTGRSSYPDNQGCIGRAWHDGSCFVDNLPDPLTEKRRWAEVLEQEWGIPKRVSNGLAMKSRCLAACAFDHSSQGRRIAVIVLESVRQNRMGPKKIDECLSAPERPQLVRFIEIMETFEPNPDYARDEGF